MSKFTDVREEVAAAFSSPANLAGLAAAFLFRTIVNVEPWWLASLVGLAIFFGVRQAWIVWQARREVARVDWDGLR